MDPVFAAKKPILCLDFDGVVNPYTSGWKGATVIPDDIAEGTIGFLLRALQHFDVCIYSSRSHQPGGIKAMQQYLRDQGGDNVWYESPEGPGLESIRFPDHKPPAMVSIDDRTLTFDGTWPTMDTLKNFKPWNKKG